MEERATHLRSAIRLPSLARYAAVNRVSLALGAAFVLGAAFYIWTTATSSPLELHHSQDPYNLLANAFLHLHLSVGRPPAGLLKLAEPYDPNANAQFRFEPKVIHDFALYHGRLFLTWGPVPVLVFLVPMHLLGFDPSTSLTAVVFAVPGLAFTLATLRVVLRKLGSVPLWICVLAAGALVLSSAVPVTLRRPQVYEDAIMGGYCFAMAGVWLATSVLLERRASLLRLSLMSLCFGLAPGARPTLGVTAAMLIPVYISLRHSLPRRQLLTALLVPIGGCLLLLAAYNQARFGSPLEVGTKYALAGINQYRAHFGDLSNLLPGLWFYGLSPPRPSILFPFLVLPVPPISYPGTLPENYLATEITGGLLSTTPILFFLVALPWIRRRRPAWLGSLAAPVLIVAGAGLAIVLFLSYDFFSVTERYEVDFATLLLLGALAAWLALAVHARGLGRRLVRIGGAFLLAWGCLTGLAFSFVGYANMLAVVHPATWAKLEKLSSPLSAAIAAISGGPVLAEVNGGTLYEASSVGYMSFESPVKTFGVAPREKVSLTIVSPSTGTGALLATMIPGVVTETRVVSSTGGAVLTVSGPGRASATYTVPVGGTRMRIPVRLAGGINHLTLAQAPARVSGTKPAVPASSQVLVVSSVSVSSHY
jgi:hypothetical protein